jgi:hypothetical protein
MQGLDSKIAYSGDIWTTKSMTFSYLGSLAHFISKEWILNERLIDFHALESKEHEGVNAAKAFVKSARLRGGLNKMSTVISDAATRG